MLGPERPREVARHLKALLGGQAEVAVVDINDLGGNILGSTLDKAGEKRLVAILKDNPLGQGHQSTPLGVVRGRLGLDSRREAIDVDSGARSLARSVAYLRSEPDRLAVPGLVAGADAGDARLVLVDAGAPVALDEHGPVGVTTTSQPTYCTCGTTRATRSTNARTSSIIGSWKSPMTNPESGCFSCTCPCES